jgi:hypothetical protein
MSSYSLSTLSICTVFLEISQRLAPAISDRLQFFFLVVISAIFTFILWSGHELVPVYSLVQFSHLFLMLPSLISKSLVNICGGPIILTGFYTSLRFLVNGDESVAFFAIFLANLTKRGKAISGARANLPVLYIITSVHIESGRFMSK